MTALQTSPKEGRAPHHRYTSEETEFLKKIVKGKSYSEINTLFNERFGQELSYYQIIGKISRLGLCNEAASNRCSDKPHHRYTSEETEFLKKIVKGRSYLEINTLFNERFGQELTMGQIKGIIKNLKLQNGINTRYIPPKNCCPPQFTLYALNNGDKPWNFRPIGSEALRSDGYMAVKVANPSVWKLKHNIIWENAHGPIPKGHIVIFSDHNKLNFSLDNLLLVSNGELAIMNHFGLISSNPEITKTGLLIARLKLLTNKRVRKLKEKGTTA